MSSIVVIHPCSLSGHLEVVMDGMTHQDSVLDQVCHFPLDLVEGGSSYQVLGSHSGHGRPVVCHLRMSISMSKSMIMSMSISIS